MKTKLIIRILYWIFIGICLQVIINLSMIISSSIKQKEEWKMNDPVNSADVYLDTMAEIDPIFIVDTTDVILPRLERDSFWYAQVTDTIVSTYPYDFDYDYKKVVYVAIDTIRKVDTASLFAYHCTHYGEIYTEIETDSCVLFVRQHINLFK